MAHTDVEKAELLSAFFSEVFTKEDLIATPTFEQRATHRHHHQRRHGRSSFGSTETKQVPWWSRTSPSSTGRTKERYGNTTELRMIFTHSLHKGQIPPSWKEANVTPIYKKGKRRIAGNYRPVSLTSMAGKCMGRPIQDATMTHMTENDLLSPKQCDHSFIQGPS